MKKSSSPHVLGNIINISYPLVVAISFSYVCNRLHVSTGLRGLSAVLESIITFSSIVIGFYTAMYGILLTLSKTQLMIEFRKRRIDRIFKFQLYDSLITSFLVLIVSIILQVIKHYPGKIANYIFIFWIFLIGYFVATTYRSISLLLKIFFAHEVDLPIDHTKSSEEKQAQIKRIKSKNG
ncbi:hypothetical protein [Loigolactobacillus bifermentans]|uniref:hypothetical protein n=1 Tax=Loigolactobacillus bifermentans TaxID=1607 RepID=UPI00070B3445|nr:hypothetical protein [Loigolactobacillus bifermentans]QGG59660.1 hypothetical protein LB003_03720 [Loigolactobacillus bifermentans]